MKKILAILLAATMLLALAACGTAADTATEPPADETAPASEAPASEAPADEGDAAETYVVGICQQMTHVALDSATEGFKAALADILGEDAVDLQRGQRRR